ncbi:hypothetical protein T484DRAFT_1781623 [Baffinella frigidus]|nr:hypothetical protein T484DRAFT_1781623 [Cryptophyta sp. CCMP2293]
MVSVAFLRLRAPQALALCFCAAVAVTGAAPSSHLAFMIKPITLSKRFNAAGLPSDVVIKTISLSKKFNAAGLPSDVVGTVAEVWGVENEDEDGSGLTVAFEADEAAKSFDYTFSEWELEKENGFN